MQCLSFNMHLIYLYMHVLLCKCSLTSYLDVSPPLEILVVMTEGSQLSGTYNISYYDAVDPAAVNTVSRFIYWYNRYSKCIMMQSLDGGQPIVSFTM